MLFLDLCVKKVAYLESLPTMISVAIVNSSYYVGHGHPILDRTRIYIQILEYSLISSSISPLISLRHSHYQPLNFHIRNFDICIVLSYPNQGISRYHTYNIRYTLLAKQYLMIFVQLV